MAVSIELTVFLATFILNSVTSTNLTDAQWWGPAELSGECNDTSIRPFKIDFNDTMIADLRARLKAYRPSRPTFENANFEYGFNTNEMSSWIEYWANEYPFEEREEYLNQYPQYKISVQGLCIHFIRVTPEVSDNVTVIPLLLLHGWPGSVREFYDVIPLLTAVNSSRNFVVEVIAPSLPGFGFSDPAVIPGLGSENMTEILVNFMCSLGYKKFVVQGGDWGALIGADLATKYPDVVIGYHTNLGFSFTLPGLSLEALGSLAPAFVVDPSLEERMYPLLSTLLRTLRESGYLHLQATKPDTIGIGLSDSPAGLLSYIFQVMSFGTRVDNQFEKDGGLSHYPKATLLDNLMYYWSTNCITTSMRIYTETFNKQFSLTGAWSESTEVPTWVIQAPYEILYQSPKILKTKFKNLLNATVLDQGGHFLALEMPEVFAGDVLDAIEAFIDYRGRNITNIICNGTCADC